MVLTPDDIKDIATEIASQIITELRKPVDQYSSDNKSKGVCETTYNNKNTFIDYFKHNERRTNRKIENERTNERGLN